MPEIKIKHVVSFSSEDKVHKAENLIKPETYRQWKCATPGEKNATVVLQFEKATQIHSIDIGNAHSAFVEILVGRSSDTVSDYQVLLVASSFMSPIESRSGTHANRVRMFGPEKLSQNTKDEKWDCVQIVCTQPFNKQITYGLSFIKFHSPSEKVEEHSESSEAKTTTTRMGAFRLKYEDDDDDSSPPAGFWFGKQKTPLSQNSSNSSVSKEEPSYASVILASSSGEMSSQNNSQKRKAEEKEDTSDEPPAKKSSTTTLDKNHIIYKEVLRELLALAENKKIPKTNNAKRSMSNSKTLESKKTAATKLLSIPSSEKKDEPSAKSLENRKAPAATSLNSPSANNKQANSKEKIPFEKIMDKVVFVLSGFVNPLRSMIRDNALEMGAKYKGDWDSSCTHLVCAFINTPKYQQVKQLNGKIVTVDWILDCYKEKKRIPWKRYKLGKSSKDTDSSAESDSELEDPTDYSAEEESDYSEEEPEDSEEEYSDRKKKNRNKQNNAKKVKNKPADSNKKAQSTLASNKKELKVSNADDRPSISSKNINSNKNHSNASPKRASPKKHNLSDSSQSPTLLPAKDESETEDEEALQDYLADTDAEGDSGGDTEDEIRKVEMELQKNGGMPSRKSYVSDENSGYSEKPDVTDLPFPELPNLFKQKHFFLFGNFSSSKQHDLHRYIIAYNGVIEDYMNDKVKYVITEAKWDKEFEDALEENEDLIFVKPTWIYKCHDTGKLVPYQPYIVIPDS